MLEKLTKTQQNILEVILILIIIGIIIFWINFWWTLKKATLLPPIIKEKPVEISEPLKPGEVGEITEEEAEEKGISPLPELLFNTSGTIMEVKSDRLIVQGSGTNFADQRSRELILIFTSSTITFQPGLKIKYQGLEGLKYLKLGMQILIEGNENIRGKAEFEARYIHIL